MPKVTRYKTNFTAGEITPLVFGRADLRAFENGASKLQNVFVLPTGGLRRRAGTRFVEEAPGPARLVAFEFNAQQTYLLVFSDLRLDIYEDDVPLVTGIATPWEAGHLDHLSWVQNADTLLIVHEDQPPQKLTRHSQTDWRLDAWTFDLKDGRLRQPYVNFLLSPPTVSPSGTSGTITLTASADLFDPLHVGQRFRIKDKEVEITAVSTAKQAAATTIEDLVDTEATDDWAEPAFSPLRGWPRTVAFHQNRLVIGGSRDLPDHLWLSRSGLIFDFDPGEGLDDEAIDFALLSDQLNAVRAVFSGRHLQIFTSGAEWAAIGDVLTPTNIQVRRQTRIGSRSSRLIPPREVEGATVFVNRSGGQLREFLFTDVEQAYQAADLTLLAGHLVNDVIDLDYDASRRLLIAVLGDGTLATVTQYRGEQVTAWSRQTSDGSFRAVAVVGDAVYLLVERQQGFMIERLEEELFLDSALSGISNTATRNWQGLDHLDGLEIRGLADGKPVGPLPVENGRIELPEAARAVTLGLAYRHAVEPMPPLLQGPGGVNHAARLRLVEASFRIRESAAFAVDLGRGLQVRLPRTMSGDAAGTPPQLFTGDQRLRTLGWRRADVAPLWRIESELPLPFTLLSVTADLRIND